MIRRETSPPQTRRSFPSIWHELDYLCKKIHYWLYTRKQKGRAGRYLSRLERVLHELPDNDLAIIRHEGLSLLCELKGRNAESIRHRKREIDLIERLHREANSPRYAESTRAYMLRDLGVSVLEERRAILKALEGEGSPQTRRRIRGTNLSRDGF